MRDAETFREMLQAALDMKARFYVAPWGIMDSALDVTEAIKEALAIAGRENKDTRSEQERWRNGE